MSIFKVKLYFSARIEEVSDMPLLDVIEKLGGWPVTNPDWDETKAIDLETLVAVIKRNFTLGVLIEEWVGPDDRNSENHIIQVSFFFSLFIDKRLNFSFLLTDRSVAIGPSQQRLLS